MTPSAWADYLDARLRLVHGWAEEGMSAIEMAVKLTPEAEQLERVIGTPIDPPFPGSSRAQARLWRERCERLETLLAQRGGEISVAPPSRPLLSMIHAVAAHPDPEQCGCQFLTDHPRPGEHDPECEHAAKS